MENDRTLALESSPGAAGTYKNSIRFRMKNRGRDPALIDDSDRARPGAEGASVTRAGGAETLRQQGPRSDGSLESPQGAAGALGRQRGSPRAATAQGVISQVKRTEDGSPVSQGLAVFLFGLFRGQRVRD